MKKKNKHGFTLVELICVVIIVGLLITVSVFGISRLIEKSKIDSKLAQEKLLIEACESYIEDNKDKAPKAIGDSTRIELGALYDYKYITEDILNSKRESCLDNSYVRIYKLNKKEYTYLPYLYCGDDKVDEVEKVPSPTVKLLFIDDNNENNNNLIFNNIEQSRIYLEMVGGEDSFGRQLELDTYSITISMRTKNSPELEEYYSSGIVNANRRTNHTIDNKIINYVDAYNATSIEVKVVATNILGGVTEVTSIAKDKVNNGN
jgi:prepilin-type N-terminal cleavage/methylation domain-containing protein